MTYLTETPWPISIAMFSIAVFFGWNAMRTSQKQAWRVAQICAGLAVVPLITDFLIETDREQVTASLTSLRNAVRQNDVQATIGFIKDEGLRTTVERQMRRIDVQSLRLKAIQIKADGTSAVSDFRANGSASLKGMSGGRHVATRWVLDWRKTGNEWKITGITQINPVTGEPQATFSVPN